VPLCDEPTGALDYETGKVVLASIKRANEELGTTAMIIKHNVAIARYILECGQAWNKVVELKDEANVFTAIAGKLGFTGARQVLFSPSGLA